MGASGRARRRPAGGSWLQLFANLPSKLRRIRGFLNCLERSDYPFVACVSGSVVYFAFPRPGTRGSANRNPLSVLAIGRQHSSAYTEAWLQGSTCIFDVRRIRHPILEPGTTCSAFLRGGVYICRDIPQMEVSAKLHPTLHSGPAPCSW